MLRKFKNESIFELIGQASEMLKDRSRQEADLIYEVSLLDAEARQAIVLAYQSLYDEKVE